MSKELFSLKMRASQAGRHISGAEKLLPETSLSAFSGALLERALHHANGKPDFINLKIESVAPENLLELDALPMREIRCGSPEEALSELGKLLAGLGIGHAPEIVDMLSGCSGMRGAILLDAKTRERLEPDQVRGVRATYMDSADSPLCGPDSAKNHFAEAIVLATKVANTPGIAAELCISDDPDYTTGYIASRELGYVRITNLKETGSPKGGRIFLYTGRRGDVPQTIEFLENKPVLVRNVPHLAKPLPDKWKALSDKLEFLRAHSLLRHVTTLESAPGPTAVLHGKEYVMLASNNYLGLADDPRVKAAAAEALEKYGAGSGGSRLTTGSLPPHDSLERRITEFKHAEAALVFNTGFAANTGIISALCGANDFIFSDELNHASIIDGCRLSRAKTVVYRHNDMRDLEEKIRAVSPSSGLIVSDGVFSMDGDIVNLPELLGIAENYGLFSMIDEAHATGVLGRTGRGVCEHFGLETEPDIRMGTLSKAIGAEGGFVCGRRLLIDFLINRARSFIFSTSLPPSVVAAAEKAFEIIESEPQRVERLRENVKFFCRILSGNGIPAQSETAIVPVIVGDEARTLELARGLLDDGIFISSIRFPTVKKGQARLRAALMSEHTHAQLELAARSIARRFAGK